MPLRRSFSQTRWEMEFQGNQRNLVCIFDVCKLEAFAKSFMRHASSKQETNTITMKPPKMASLLGDGSLGYSIMLRGLTGTMAKNSERTFLFTICLGAGRKRAKQERGYART